MSATLVDRIRAAGLPTAMRHLCSTEQAQHHSLLLLYLQNLTERVQQLAAVRGELLAEVRRLDARCIALEARNHDR